ncbi:MAG TPA: DUF2934 domain-containing protein [Devosia sp.]|jgi:ribosomal protein L12E/L44/L45/RPP1/RPP2|nr:DUF2934 domain-containing protein [Devosia sp.]
MQTAGHADEAAIREQAYYFWEQDGRPDGREAEYWARAVVAVTDRAQLSTLTEEAPKKATKPRAAAAPKTAAEKPAKAAASKTKASPAKSEPAKPKKK